MNDGRRRYSAGRADFRRNICGDSGQAEIAASVTVGKLLAIEPEEVKQRRVQIVPVHLVLGGGEGELIRPAVHDALLQSCARLSPDATPWAVYPSNRKPLNRNRPWCMIFDNTRSLN